MIGKELAQLNAEFCFWFAKIRQKSADRCWCVASQKRSATATAVAAAAIRTNFHLLRPLSRDSFVQSSSDVPPRRYETIEVLRGTVMSEPCFDRFVRA